MWKKVLQRITGRLDEEDAREQKCANGAKDPDLGAKIEALLEKQRNKKAMQKQLRQSGKNQISEVDTDARMLRKNGKTVCGYNAQIASDVKYKLIVVAEVIQNGNDSGQLEPMMTKSREATGSERLIGLADAGYCSGAQLKSCEEKGIEVYVPIPKHSICKGKNGRFGSNDFRYDAQDDTYVCPAEQRLIREGSISIKSKRYFSYHFDGSGLRELSAVGPMFGKNEIDTQSVSLGTGGCDGPASQKDECRCAIDVQARLACRTSI